MVPGIHYSLACGIKISGRISCTTPFEAFSMELCARSFVPSFVSFFQRMADVVGLYIREGQANETTRFVFVRSSLISCFFFVSDLARTYDTFCLLVVVFFVF